MTGTWKLETITPARAAELLANRGDNVGRMSPSQEDAWMENFCGIILRNEWQITPQGITLGADDTLLDGVNRLGGVVKSGRSIQIWVYRDPSIRSVHALPIDRHKRRPDWFIAGREKQLMALAGTALGFHISVNRGNLSSVQLATLADAFRPEFTALGFDKLSVPRTSILATTSFQLACMIHLRNGTASLSYLERIVRALHDDTPHDLPPFALAFIIAYGKERRHPAGIVAPRVFRALTERLGGQIQFKKVADDRGDYVAALRKAYQGAMPGVALPVKTVSKKTRTLWTDEEVAILATAARERWSIHKTGVSLRRTHVAIRSKASDLGIPLG